LTTATAAGNRAEQLQILAQTLAKAITECTDEKSLAPLAKQYRETIKELDEIQGGDTDDEISRIIGFRQAAGRPGAVRENRSDL
jgi:hypothetical protein